MSDTQESVPASSQPHDFSREEKRVIFASSLATVFHWYDFYLYATLAPFFAALFCPKGNDPAALLSAFLGRAADVAGAVVAEIGVEARALAVLGDALLPALAGREVLLHLAVVLARVERR